MRFTAVLFLTLAVLNVGVGGVVTLDTDPLNTQKEAGGRAGNELLHLQLFGLFHLHESIIEEHIHQLKPPPGVIEYDTTNQTETKGLFLSTGLISGPGPGPDPSAGPGIHSGNYGAGWLQSLISDYLHSSTNSGVILLMFKDRLLSHNDLRLTGPFLQVPQKPPIL